MGRIANLELTRAPGDRRLYELKGVGSLRLELRSSSRLRPRYALVDGKLELGLAKIEYTGWGRRPVKLTIDDGTSVEPGLLLLAVFVVRALTEDAQRNAAAVAAVGRFNA